MLHREKAMKQWRWFCFFGPVLPGRRGDKIQDNPRVPYDQGSIQNFLYVTLSSAAMRGNRDVIRQHCRDQAFTTREFVYPLFLFRRCTVLKGCLQMIRDLPRFDFPCILLTFTDSSWAVSLFPHKHYEGFSGGHICFIMRIVTQESLNDNKQVTAAWSSKPTSMDSVSPLRSWGVSIFLWSFDKIKDDPWCSTTGIIPRRHIRFSERSHIIVFYE